MSDKNAPRSTLELLHEAEGATRLRRLSILFRLSGPGWLQAAVTLGGGTLVGALYLGVIGGYRLIWVQPVAMFGGVIMLAAIAYVTLSTGERPFLTVKNKVSPTLAWGWLVATVVADSVFCMAQFSLGTAAIQQNLGAGSVPAMWITGGFFVVSMSLVWAYLGEGRWADRVEAVLKVLVAIVVVSFFGVVVVLVSGGAVPLGKVLTGYIPNPTSLFRASEELQAAIGQTGAAATYWDGYVESSQRNIIVGAFGAAVGINMTFLLPYTLLRRGWGTAHRTLSRYDLVLGLLIPFVLATSFLVVASASQFHASYADVLTTEGEPFPESAGAYNQIVDQRLLAMPIDESLDVIEQRARLPLPERRLAAMLVRRDAGSLASTLTPFLGKLSHPIFGIGVLAMAVSTMLVHLLMNGYAITEAFGKVGNKKIFLYGALIPAFAGLFSPYIWRGASRAALAVPASVIATTLLPVAYLTFLLLMNSHVVQSAAPIKQRRAVNALMLFATFLATLGSVWVLWNSGVPGYVGIVGLVILAVIGIVGFRKRNRRVSNW